LFLSLFFFFELVLLTLFVLTVVHSLSSFFFYSPLSSQFYTLSLHDALPISTEELAAVSAFFTDDLGAFDQRFIVNQRRTAFTARDRKSTRLNSSHVSISYAVFCLKKKKYMITNELLTIVIVFIVIHIIVSVI